MQINSTKTLPASYSLYRTIDLSKDFKALVLLNVASVALLVLFGLLFVRLGALLRPDVSFSMNVLSSLAGVLWLLAAYVLVMVVHELLHGVFFWIFTGERPIFGLRGAYAFAAAPAWFIPRNPYLVVGLAPLVGISLIGLLLFPFVPVEVFHLLLLSMTLNAAGAVGDLMVVSWLLTQPAHVLVCDRGDAFSAYRPTPV